MSNINENLEKIQNAIYGEEVRGAIVDSIKQCYDDNAQEGNSNAEVIMSRGNYRTLRERLDSLDYVSFTMQTDQEIVKNTDFEVPHEYKLGGEGLIILAEGSKLIKDINYIEIDSLHIQFKDWDVPEGTNLEFICNTNKVTQSDEAYIQELEEENAAFKNLLPFGQKTGENVTLEDSGEIKLKKLRLIGNDNENNINFTISNKNIIKPVKFNDSVPDCGAIFSGNGSSYKLNGSVTVNTAKATAYRITTTKKASNYASFIDNSDVDILLEKGTYTISIKCVSGSSNNSALVFSYRLDKNAGASANKLYAIGNITSTTKINDIIQKTFIVEEDNTPFSTIMQIDRNNVATYNDLQFAIMLEKNDKATNYEEHKEQNYTFPLKQTLNKEDYLAEDGIHHIAKEEIEEYTEEQKAIYNEIMQTAKSYKGRTHIFGTDSTSAIFDVEYYKDIEAYVNSKMGGVANE